MKSKKFLYIIAAAIWLFMSYSIFFFIADERIISLASEDGVFEYAGAILFLLSAILFLAIFLKNRKKSNTFIITNIFFLLLGCAFLFAFLEEISWGQRILNVSSPQFFTEHSLDGETKACFMRAFFCKIFIYSKQ